ncbi:hypothetical protein FF38_11875 [Lucilia cuprina]|uniref:Secreted protein n=1 Tax=Lucilia cuprina TaxID=7375 RepID=A0A0L0BYD5_LUCCU|nr:hypothetical protein FF38_11875 [Lucilia cuprina]
MLKIFVLILLISIIHIYDVPIVFANKTKSLFLECSCLHAQDHNGTSTSPSLVALNASTVRHAKNDCFIIFISGSNEEIVSVRFKHIQLRPKYTYSQQNG